MALFFLRLTPVTAQTSTPPSLPDSMQPMCMVVMPGTAPGGPASFAMPASLSNPASLVSCTASGKLKAYFEDVDLGNGSGFDDGGVSSICGVSQTLGQARRDVVCAVLGYLEATISIHSSVTAGNPLIIKFGAAGPTSFGWPGVNATAMPNYPVNSPGYHHSYMGNAIIYGGTGLGAYHCGEILVNFAHGYNYCSSFASAGRCEEDFYSVILHEVTHLLGFSSAISREYTSTSTAAITLSLGANTFTKFDEQFLYRESPVGTLTKVVTGTTMPALNVPAATLAIPGLSSTGGGGIWLTAASLTTSRENQPVVDQPSIAPGVNMSFSHLEEDFLRTSSRSPGFVPAYVMSWQKKPGLARRTYSLQELRVLSQLGFTFIPSYPITNRPPNILTKIIDLGVSTGNGVNYHLAQTPPAANAGLYIATTTCHEVRIDLNALSGTGAITDWNPATSAAVSSHTMGLSDPDGNAMSVYPNPASSPDGIWVIEGCAPDAANTSPIILNAARNVITFRPRNNFTGRARFGFHLYDGIERGSFVVVTVDVAKDPACYANVCNLVMNGDFESGTDYNRYDAATGAYVMPAIVDNVNFYNYYVERGGHHNEILADGVEQLVPPASSNDDITAIVDSYMPAYCYGPYSSWYPSSPPPPVTQWPSFPAPNTTTSPNKRYLYNSCSQLSGYGDRNLTLHNTLVAGAVYNISFDYYMTRYSVSPTAVAIVPAASFSGQPLNLYFNSTFYTGAITYPSSSPNLIPGAFSWAGSGWQTYTSSFTYTGSAANRYMRIVYDHGATSLADHFLIDNVSLTRDLCPAISSSSTTLPATLAAYVPGGHVTYQWTLNGTPITGATGATYAATAYGTYGVVVTDDNGCSSAGCSVTYSFADPCAAFTASAGGMPTFLTGTISSLPANPWNAYYIPGALTISASGSSVAFTNCRVLMADNASIDVDPVTKLIISNSHLATCPLSTDMWQGITLATDLAQVLVTGDGLIEDAQTAITSVNAANRASGYVIETDGAIFNRNLTGVYIGTPGDATDYAFKKTVFTARQLDISTAPVPAFASWPSTASLLAAAPANLPYPPYRIDAPAAGYARTACHNAAPAAYGMHLSGCGSATPGWAYYLNYTGIQAGDNSGAALLSLFDNMQEGIHSINSNLLVRNCAFIRGNARRTGPMSFAGGRGIFSDVTTPGLQKQLDVSTTNSITNKFYENHTGVESHGSYNLTVNAAYFSSSNTAGDPDLPVGSHAITGSSGNYVDIVTDDNTIENHAVGIAIHNDAPASPSVLQGSIAALRNRISLPAALPGRALYPATQAILVDNPANSTAFSPSPFGVFVADNTLTTVYQGINVNSYANRGVTVGNNTVTMQDASTPATQYGIQVLNCSRALVANCRVSSNYLGNAAPNDRARAFYLSQNMRPTVVCNDEWNIAGGFEFMGGQAGTFWNSNTMKDNHWGYILGGIIGNQTSMTRGCYNRWMPSGWSGANLQTAVEFGINPGNPLSLSILYVRNNTLELPNFNSWIVSSPGTPYVLGPSLKITSSASPYCEASIKSPGTGAATYRLALQAIARDSVAYGDYPLRQKWIAQMQTYKAALLDTAMYNCSTVLQDYVTTARPTRIGWLSALEDTLYNGYDADATAMLLAGPPPAGIVPGPSSVVVADGGAADSIVDNYIAYFNLYLKWHGGLFTGSSDTAELTTLALKCPIKDGAIIYQARALLAKLTNAIINYDDNCGEGSGGGGGSERRAPSHTGVVAYDILPNPNNGSFAIVRSTSTKEHIVVDVTDVLGRKVYSQSLDFGSREAQVSLLHAIPGIYVVTVHGGVDTYNFKLLVQ